MSNNKDLVFTEDKFSVIKTPIDQLHERVIKLERQVELLSHLLRCENDLLFADWNVIKTRTALKELGWL